MAALTPRAMLTTLPDTSYFRQARRFVQRPGTAPMGACYAHFNEYLNSIAITSGKCAEFILTSLGSDILSVSSLPGRFKSVSNGNVDGWWSHRPCRSHSSSPSPISALPNILPDAFSSDPTQVQTESRIILFPTLETLPQSLHHRSMASYHSPSEIILHPIGDPTTAPGSSASTSHMWRWSSLPVRSPNWDVLKV